MASGLDFIINFEPLVSRIHVIFWSNLLALPTTRHDFASLALAIRWERGELELRGATVKGNRSSYAYFSLW